MKKNLKKILCIITIGISQLAFSQVEFGVKAGAGLSNTTIIHGTSSKRTGFLGGLVAKMPLSYKNEKNYIQAELMYTNQGEYSLDRQNKKYKAFLNYINIPILYKYYFDDQGKDFFLEAGPQFGFKVSEKFDEDEPEINNNVPKSFDFAIALGVGYSYQRKYEINLRYNLGMIDTYNFNKWDNGKNKSSFLTLALTYYFK